MAQHRDGGQWTPGPPRPHLPDRALHVWRADLHACSQELAQLLTHDERARAARLLSPSQQQLWSRARGLLRMLLARYLRQQPQHVRLTVSQHGKPQLPQRQLMFNLSHSASLALYAFSRTAAVGVDVESANRPIHEAAIAERMLGAQHAQRLRALADPAARTREFLRLWTRHEAQLKCIGIGIGIGAHEQRGASGQAGASGDARTAGKGEPEQRLWVAELDMGPRVAGAVACQHPPSELCCWEWPAR
jgi:4'-phosphopantetheinyl transferase